MSLKTVPNYRTAFLVIMTKELIFARYNLIILSVYHCQLVLGVESIILAIEFCTVFVNSVSRLWMYDRTTTSSSFSFSRFHHPKNYFLSLFIS